MGDLQHLVDAGDPGPLLAAVDGLCAQRDYDGLVRLAAACRAAVELGRQLWPVAMHVDYRLANEAPAPYAAAVVVPGAGRFALGPLTEVAAGRHPWEALQAHLTHPAARPVVAAERVLRGEDLRGEESARPQDLVVPLALAPWEPEYALPSYGAHEATFPPPADPVTDTGPLLDLPTGGPAMPPDEAVEAFEELVRPWTHESGGRVSAVAVQGVAATALGLLTDRARLRPLRPAEALALLQWTGASGGAHGRRPGGARGRTAAWEVAAALCGVPWPLDPVELGEAVAELRWFAWTGPDDAPGWSLRLAVEDPVDGLAWAVEAQDRVTPPLPRGDAPGSGAGGQAALGALD